MPVLYDSPPSSSPPSGINSFLLAPSSSSSFRYSSPFTWLCGALLVLTLILATRSAKASYRSISSRGVSTMSQKSDPSLAPPISQTHESQSMSAQPQPYDGAWVDSKKGPQQPPSRPQEQQRHPATIASSSSRPLSFTPTATAAGEKSTSWPPPPPMPTLSLVELPEQNYPPYPYPYQPRAQNSRDEYYSQSPDQYFPPYPSTQQPKDQNQFQPQASSQVQGSYKTPYQNYYQYNYGYPAYSPPSAYPATYPWLETSILPPLHPDASNPPLSLPPLRKPRMGPTQGHRRSYSQKIIYPKPLTHSPHPSSSSAPELFRSDPDLIRDNAEFGASTAVAPESSPGASPASGIEVAEEIIVAAEGWRRHTRVYGGGVCMACLESEEEMKNFAGPILLEDPVEAEIPQPAPAAGLLGFHGEQWQGQDQRIEEGEAWQGAGVREGNAREKREGSGKEFELDGAVVVGDMKELEESGGGKQWTEKSAKTAESREEKEVMDA